MKKLFMIVLCSLMFLPVLCGCGDTADQILQNEETTQTVETQEVSETTEALSAEPEQETGISVIYVYICGAVKYPGVYELEAGDRVYKLIDLAGGFTKDAAQESINLADMLSDGQMIRILTQEESIQQQVLEAEAEEQQALIPEGYTEDGRIDINQASLEQLMTLSGIGEAKAQRIIEYRENYGPFEKTEDIMNISGIGEETYKNIENSIAVQ